MKERLPYWLEPESRRLDFKEEFPKGDKIARTVVAFANGAGGKIVFGVQSEPREIKGIPDNELFALEERVANHILDLCVPAIIPEMFIQNVEGKNLLVVQIFPGFDKPYYLRKIGTINRLANDSIIAGLERAKRNISFDGLAEESVAWNDIKIDSFVKDYEKASGVDLGKEPVTGSKTNASEDNRKLDIDVEKLRNLGLVTQIRSDYVPTNAAILLADSDIRKSFFPNAKIELARFKGTETKEFLDQASIFEPLHRSIEPCISFIKRNIALGSTISEVYRRDRWEYPLEAVREALINAVIHRDYSILGSDIKVAIFDDMLEITSPGTLPDYMSPNELGTGRSELRNRVLAPLFKQLKLIEAWGTGIKKMRLELANYPEIELELKELGNTFQVQFKKLIRRSAGEKRKDITTPEVTPDVTPEVTLKENTTDPFEDKLLLVISGEMSAQDILEALQLSDAKHLREAYISPAIKQGLIEMTIPDKPRSRFQKYRLTKKGRKFLSKIHKEK